MSQDSTYVYETLKLIDFFLLYTTVSIFIDKKWSSSIKNKKGLQKM